ncbi:hypothetical protein [Paenibacillus sp. y28]|uniref:hypothetical protein n=1 Tax=Paenibacillus sp. y28 TaxID=3129110 RepID=UPI00301A16CB
MDIWNVKETLFDRVNYYSSQLNFGLVYCEERMKSVNQFFSSKGQRQWFTDYCSSPGFIGQQIKTKVNQLAEDQKQWKAMERIATYLITPEYRNEQHEREFKSDREGRVLNTHRANNIRYLINRRVLHNGKNNVHQINDGLTILTNNKVKMLKLRESSLHGMAEKLGCQTEGKDSEIQRLQRNLIEKKIREKESLRRFKARTRLTPQDMQLKDVKQIQECIDMLGQKLGYSKYGYTPEDRRRIQENIIFHYGRSELFKLKQLYKQLSEQLYEVRDSLRGYIQFKRITSGSTVYNFESDTGYFADKYEHGKRAGEGDWIEISNNRIEFNNPSHIKNLLKHYPDLRDSLQFKFEHPLWSILFDFEALLEEVQPQLNQEEQQVLRLYCKGFTVHEIYVALKSSVVYHDEQPIRYAVEQKIPRLLAEAYLSGKEKYISRRNGYALKCCTGCSEWLVPSERNFSKDKRKKDGLQSKCKKCDAKRKMDKN